MGIRDWLFKNSRDAEYQKISCKELFEAAQDVRIRELAFMTCVNMIAGVIGKCEFRTYEQGEEIKGREYWLWNVEPNVNQNSTAFLHKMISKLYRENEALVVEARRRGEDTDMLLVADSWTVPEAQAVKPDEYRDVMVESLTFNKTFRESDVLHFKLNSVALKPVLDKLGDSYTKMIDAAVKNYEWTMGQHWKAKVSATAQSVDKWKETYQQIMTEQLKPFFQSNAAVLPQFDGYDYEDVAGDRNGLNTRDVRQMINDIFDFTAKAFMIPPVLIGGEVAGTQDALSRWLTICIDPLSDQLQEEINRKRYGYEAWKSGNYLQIDTSKLIHFDLFENAANIEKLVGSGYSYNDIQRSTGGAQIDEPWADEHFFTKNFDLATNFLKGGE